MTHPTQTPRHRTGICQNTAASCPGACVLDATHPAYKATEQGCAPEGGNVWFVGSEPDTAQRMAGDAFMDLLAWVLAMTTTLLVLATLSGAAGYVYTRWFA